MSIGLSSQAAILFILWTISPVDYNGGLHLSKQYTWGSLWHFFLNKWKGIGHFLLCQESKNCCVKAHKLFSRFPPYLTKFLTATDDSPPVPDEQVSFIKINLLFQYPSFCGQPCILPPSPGKQPQLPCQASLPRLNSKPNLSTLSWE